tara:strand:+ start:101 stop:763 length:663 start_codon:yes stop_codon:yes gene_type:complete
MKNLIYFFLVYSSFSYSQLINSCGWEFNVTSGNATIAIQQENFSDIMINGTDINTSIQYIDCPMWIGVFYQPSEGEDLQCAGFTQWTSNQNMAITAWGDDSTTTEQDGMLNGDSYIFGLCIDNYEGFFVGIPSMSNSGMFTDTYATNSFASLESVTFGPLVSCVSCIIEDCWPINISENKNSNFLLRRCDIYGRIIKESHPKGLYFEVFDNKSVIKQFGF